jgi:multidrug efflux pump subunit AcrA (membrane-fusion protein)
MNTPFDLALSTALVSLGFLAVFFLVLAGIWWLILGSTFPRKARVVRPANAILSPASGVVVSVAIHAGERVAFGQELCEFEAEGYTHAIRAARPGEIGVVLVAAGDHVDRGQVILEYRVPKTVGSDEPGASLD